MSYKQFAGGNPDECSPFKRKNLIVLDWDDTLFPTSAFRTHQHKKDKTFMSKLVTLVSYMEQILIKMINLYGASNIIIVTNASSNWIHKCLNIDIVQNIFLNFQNILLKNKIQTISASTKAITSKYPRQYYKWKEVIFYKYFTKYFDISNDTYCESINCITSIGDSICEYKASNTASKYIPNRILNRIKFKTDPSINDMILQWKYILSICDKFGCNIKDMKLNYSSMISMYKSCYTSYSDTTDN